MPGSTRGVVSLFFVGLMIALAGCGGGGKSEQASAVRTVAPPAAGPGSVAWEARMTGRLTPPITETPVVRLDGLSADRSVLFAMQAVSANGFWRDFRFSALDSRTGAVLWSEDDVEFHAVSGDLVFLAIPPNSTIGNYRLVARDLRSGAVRWERQVAAYALWRLFTSGAVVVGLAQANAAEGPNGNLPTTFRLFALSRETGADRWTVERTSAPVAVGAGALSRNLLYLSVGATSGGGEAVGLDADTGAVVWTGANLHRESGPLLVGAGAAYSGSPLRQRLDPNTGAVSWEQPVPGGADVIAFGNTLGGDDTLLSVFRRGSAPFVEALDPASGAPKWSSNVTAVPPAIARGFGFNFRSIDNAVGVAQGGNVYYVERFLYTRADETAAQFTLSSLAADDGSVRWTIPLFNAEGVYDYDLNHATLVGPNGLVYGLRGLNIVAVRTPDTD